MFKKTQTQFVTDVYSYRFLATGESFRSLAFAYQLGRKTVADSVYMTCRAIVRMLLNTYMPRPSEEAWREIAAGFWEKWQFPNCIGAIDGKHICIQAPANSGSQFFNYKKTFSIVLLALVDADSRFRLIQVGDFGRSSDGGVYSNSAWVWGWMHKHLTSQRMVPCLDQICMVMCHS